jgi:hypothetical protein
VAHTETRRLRGMSTEAPLVRFLMLPVCILEIRSLQLLNPRRSRHVATSGRHHLIPLSSGSSRTSTSTFPVAAVLHAWIYSCLLTRDRLGKPLKSPLLRSFPSAPDRSTRSLPSSPSLRIAISSSPSTLITPLRMATISTVISMSTLAPTLVSSLGRFPTFTAACCTT